MPNRWLSNLGWGEKVLGDTILAHPMHQVVAKWGGGSDRGGDRGNCQEGQLSRRERGVEQTRKGFRLTVDQESLGKAIAKMTWSSSSSPSIVIRKGFEGSRLPVVQEVPG